MTHIEATSLDDPAPHSAVPNDDLKCSAVRAPRAGTTLRGLPLDAHHSRFCHR